MTSKPKLAFSIKGKNKSRSSSNAKEASYDASNREKVLEGFEALSQKKKEEPLIHPDLQGPLVIPALKDSRQTLQEQARAKREQPKDEEALQAGKEEGDESKVPNNVSKEDQEAIEALKRDAGGSNRNTTHGKKRVIQAQENTFQNNTEQPTESDQLKEDLERHAPDLSVDSESYKQVPIADFGAALLRGMGWDGSSTDQSDAPGGLPRPSRLGLGATPKLLDMPTHRKGRRRQDQVQREERLKEQQAEYQKQRELQILKDKQQTIQVGSIVSVLGNKRAIIRQWNGVPGLNMILVQFEGEHKPTKVKKGSAQLIDRPELQQRPFNELEIHEEKQTKYLGKGQKEDRIKRERDDDDHRRTDSVRRRDKSSLADDDYDDHRDRRRDYDDRDDRRRGEKRRYDDDDRRRRREHSNDRYQPDRDRHSRGSNDRRSSRRDDEDGDRRKRRKSSDSRREEKRSSFHSDQKRPQTWLTPNIRVRVISSNFGRSHNKRKGVVVDVTTRGATLKMESGEILQVPERYLETALPKVGGNAIILTGKNKLAKGKLMERDSRSNKGAVQLFEDMNIVNTSLDDIAEWCLPLDDDLMD